MNLNPFKESNLNDLQSHITEFFSDHFSKFFNKLKDLYERFKTKGRERLTVMFIPHSEKRIINFHISIFAISIFIGIFIITVSVTSLMIINHTSTIKEVSKLKRYGTNSKIQMKYYKEEINKLYSIFQKFKPEITYLYSLTPGSDVDSLWAKGGVPNPDPKTVSGGNPSPPLEILNIEEIAREVKTTRKILAKIKKFLEYRKKIIENTPSIWPVNGSIISRYGNNEKSSVSNENFSMGLNIEAFPGAEIKATAPGKVNDIRWDPVFGLVVTIKHKYGFVTSYSHCQRISVELDQQVSKGEVIAYVGRTGEATRYICYYQVKIGTRFVDPLPYLNKISDNQ